VEAGGFDWPRFRTRLDAELDRLEGAYRNTLTNAGVTIHDQRATLADPHTVRLATGEEVTARHILVATGGRPFVPEFPGSELAASPRTRSSTWMPCRSGRWSWAAATSPANSPAS
jgi:glutathione reductase (NADPH)